MLSVASVLVVDSDPSSAKSIAHSVRALGHEARTLSSAESATQKLARERVAVMIAELRNQGLELLRVAKTISRGTRVILVSSDASANEYKRAINEGAVEVL